MSEKIEFIKNFEGLEISNERKALFSAFVSCLDATEACSLLDMQFRQEYFVRRAILKKIGRDIQSDMQKCHKELIGSLLQIFEFQPYKKKQSAGYCLSFLYEFLPRDLQDEIATSFLQSKYIGFRRTGCIMLRDWRNSFRLLVEKIWNIYQEPECAELIINHFSIEFLKENSQSLQTKVIGTRYLTQLYLKIAANDPSYLKQLQEIDEITFAYVSAKLNNPLSNIEAFSMFERHKNNEKIGLLIWCFGQMRLWSVLEMIYLQIGQVVYEKAL